MVSATGPRVTKTSLVVRKRCGCSYDRSPTLALMHRRQLRIQHDNSNMPRPGGAVAVGCSRYAPPPYWDGWPPPTARHAQSDLVHQHGQCLWCMCCDHHPIKDIRALRVLYHNFSIAAPLHAAHWAIKFEIVTNRGHQGAHSGAHRLEWCAMLVRHAAKHAVVGEKLEQPTQWHRTDRCAGELKWRHIGHKYRSRNAWRNLTIEGCGGQSGINSIGKRTRGYSIEATDFAHHAPMLTPPAQTGVSKQPT